MSRVGRKNQYWFKAKQYGWGWYPATWQGWLTTLLFVLSVIVASWLLLGDEPESYTPVLWYVLWVALSIGVTLSICYKKGEKPRWRWGK